MGSSRSEKSSATDSQPSAEHSPSGDPPHRGVTSPLVEFVILFGLTVVVALLILVLF